MLAIRLVESTSRTAREPTEKERQDIKKYGLSPGSLLIPYTGALKLGITGHYYDELQKVVADDGKHQRVEQFLNEFVVKIEAEAVRRKRHEEHLERQRQVWEEEARLRREREAGLIESDSELGQWIVWARHKADWIDPILNAECPVLDEDECPVLDEE